MPDLTDYRQHGSVAKGGKVTVVKQDTDPWAASPNTVKNALLKIMYQSATDPERPRVAPNNPTAASGPIQNDKHHFVGLSILELSKRGTAVMGKHVNQHEVVHALFDLRSQQLVKFHVSKAQGTARRSEPDSGSHLGGGSTPYGGIPVRLQLTAKGVAEGARLMGAVEPERVKELVATAPPQEVVVKEVEPVAVPEPEPPDARTVYSDAVERFLADDYPEIKRVSLAAGRITQAADLLRAAGHDTLADMALAERDNMTPLEQEVSRFVAEFARMFQQQKGGQT